MTKSRQTELEELNRKGFVADICHHYGKRGAPKKIIWIYREPPQREKRLKEMGDGKETL